MSIRSSLTKNAGSGLPSAEDYVKRWEGPPDSGPLSGAAKNIAQCYQALWEKSEFNILEKSHNRACQIHAPEGKVIYGRDQLSEFLKGYINSFSKGIFRVHHWIVNEEEGKNTRIALRWSFSAEHTGFGSFGVQDRIIFEGLFGEFNPSGKLPFEIPSSMKEVKKQKEDLPDDSYILVNKILFYGEKNIPEQGVYLYTKRSAFLVFLS